MAAWLAEAAKPDTWVVLSTYKLVEGAKLTPGRRWDCTDPDPQKHWTSEVESYCIVDLLAALDALPPGVQVVDPRDRGRGLAVQSRRRLRPLPAALRRPGAGADHGLSRPQQVDGAGLAARRSRR